MPNTDLTSWANAVSNPATAADQISKIVNDDIAIAARAMVTGEEALARTCVVGDIGRFVSAMLAADSPYNLGGAAGALLAGHPQAAYPELVTTFPATTHSSNSANYTSCPAYNGTDEPAFSDTITVANMCMSVDPDQPVSLASLGITYADALSVAAVSTVVGTLGHHVRILITYEDDTAIEYVLDGTLNGGDARETDVVFPSQFCVNSITDSGSMGYALFTTDATYGRIKSVAIQYNVNGWTGPTSSFQVVCAAFCSVIVPPTA
jgi:hypothetical protein